MVCINQDNNIFENWRCENTNQDLNNWGKWHLLIELYTGKRLIHSYLRNIAAHICSCPDKQ